MHLLLPKVNADQITPPTKCVDPKCQGRKFRFHQPVRKALRDRVYHEVQAHRYQCLKCGRTFRVYPTGVSSAHTSLRVKGLAVMLYLLGLSSGATSLALGAVQRLDMVDKSISPLQTSFRLFFVSRQSGQAISP